MEQEIKNTGEHHNQSPERAIKQSRQPLARTEYIPLQVRVENKMGAIFRQFSFSTITFHLFALNCIMWLSVHLVYYFSNIKEWDCVQFTFFAKFQPSITYNYQIWRLLLSSVMFRGGIQFYFNNFALHMLGYVIEKQSKLKFVVTFYVGILGGHLLSCCMTAPDQLTVGTSCGTIALLPIQICRYIKLRRSNPIQARGRRNFLIFNIITNFVINILAIFDIDQADWVSHIGCIIAGVLLLIFFQMRDTKSDGSYGSLAQWKRKTLQYGSLALLALFYLGMVLIIWIYFPHIGRGKRQLEKFNLVCYSNI